jgi:hypothetical protein
MTNPNFSDINISPPVWMGDFSSRESILPAPGKLVASAFNAEDAVKVALTANAAVDAISIAVTALSGKIPTGTMLDFGGKKFARVTAEAALNATAIAVSAIPTALVTNDAATYKGVGKKRVASGTLVGRTYTERDNKVGFGPADVTNDDEIYLTAYEVVDLGMLNDCEFYRHNRLVKENFLPGWAGLSNTVKTKIRSLYACIGGVN